MTDPLQKIELLDFQHKITLSLDQQKELQQCRNSLRLLLISDYEKSLRRIKAIHYSQGNKAGTFLENYLRQ